MMNQAIIREPSKFQEGQTVKVVKLLDTLSSNELIGFVGKITEIDTLPNGNYNYDVSGHYMHEEELELYPTTRKIKIGSHSYFREMIAPAMCYEGYSLDKEIVIAVSPGNYGDWAAYYETPWCHGPVLVHGAKMPEIVAKHFFPEVAKYRKYRP